MQKINGTLRGARMLAVGAAFTLASAAFGTITGDPLTITATSSAGTAQIIIHDLDGVWSPDGTTWTYQGINNVVPMVDISNGATIAELNMGDLLCHYVFDPELTLNFTAVAGVSATTFTFSSGLLSFASISNAIATASAGMTVVDRNLNGATLTGTQGGFAYQANYNGLVPAGTMYASAFSSVGAGPTGPAAFGPTNIGTVSSMSSQWGFTLSARDSATGTSVFTIVPAPGSVAVLGLFGIVAGGRRRR